ncbi:GNAT family N-acetyltransferase [Pedobacter soli]|uniref:ElaA protein n=1 Tax=Pedobacter soli TaxID=390242 RepID=A0A1G6V7N4_9SPHI|nr:GNAT family N-acetyltransferase [Pedobacter soli]SDD49700.1 ElaA protein [Pedobacter soli]
MKYHTLVKAFCDLSPDELYQIMRLRIEVFVIEQQCFYQDADNKDQQCHHLMLFKDNELVAYARIVPAGLSFEEASIGRVITSAQVRGTGAGKVLMEAAMQTCRQIFGNVPIRIGAQTYAQAFYAALGFETSGDEFMEDGIPHIEMVAHPL